MGALCWAEGLWGASKLARHGVAVVFAWRLRLRGPALCFAEGLWGREQARTPRSCGCFYVALLCMGALCSAEGLWGREQARTPRGCSLALPS